MGESVSALEMDAKRLRADLFAHVAEARERARPANIVAAVKSQAEQSLAPITDSVVGAAKSYGGVVALIAAGAGMIVAFQRKQHVQPKEERKEVVGASTRSTSLPSGRGLLLAAAGAVAGIAVANSVAITPGERQFLRAAGADLQEAFANETSRRIHSALSADSTRANAMKLGLAALAVLLKKG